MLIEVGILQHMYFVGLGLRRLLKLSCKIRPECGASQMEPQNGNKFKHLPPLSPLHVAP